MITSLIFSQIINKLKITSITSLIYESHSQLVVVLMTTSFFNQLIVIVILIIRLNKIITILNIIINFLSIKAKMDANKIPNVCQGSGIIHNGTSSNDRAES